MSIANRRANTSLNGRPKIGGNFIKMKYYGENLTKYKKNFLLGEQKVNNFGTAQFYQQRNGRAYWLAVTSQFFKNSVDF
jgi:hypothetical protein